MLTSISLQNFKCYKDKTTFPLSKINLLTGINGKGKSTFLQSMLLFRQSVEHNLSTTELLLNGSCVRLGEFNDAKNAFTPKTFPTIYFLFEVHDPEFQTDLRFYYDFVENEIDKGSLVLDRFHIDSPKQVIMIYPGNYLSKREWNRIQRQEKGEYKDPDGKVESFSFLLPNRTQIKPDYHDKSYFLEEYLSFKHIHYVSADRLGPQEYYPKFSLNDFLEVGKRGEKTLDVLDKVKNEVLKSDVRVSGEDNSILALSGEWLSYVLDTKVSVIINSESSYISTLKFRFNDKDYTPPNVGFGYSYILPIIVSGLVAKDGEILIIENPEAHLHPGAQSRLAEFLARVASMGVQVFIESHSEHILNGIRIAAVEREGKPKILENTDISILYFQGSGKESFVSIPVEPDGKIRKWPEGFFDQLEKDTEILYNL
jgi:predicted ATPase